MDDEIIGNLTKEDLLKYGFSTGNAMKFLKAFASTSQETSLIQRSEATEAVIFGIAETSCMSSSVQDKVDQLIALCDKDKPLSASDVAAIHQLLAAGSGVVDGIGKSR